MTDSQGNIRRENALGINNRRSPKPKDSMPKYFKEMEKHGLKITIFTTEER
jgi:hypothetical protein